jgi:hypothetical protein
MSRVKKKHKRWAARDVRTNIQNNKDVIVQGNLERKM